MARREGASAAGSRLLGSLLGCLLAGVLAACGAGPGTPNGIPGPTLTSPAVPSPTPPVTGSTPSASPTVSPSGSPNPTPTGTPAPALLAQMGSSGKFVVGVQLRLGLAVDGVYGRLTAAAVSTFQAARQLTVTGTVDVGTWALLERIPPVCPPPAAAPVTSAPGAGRTVALTFDDGAGAEVPALLAVLAGFRVHATFFDTGQHDAANLQYARAIVAAGDALGNHTFDHPKNWGYQRYYPQTSQRWELTRTSAVQTPVLGHSPCVMRPPGGAYDARSLALVRSLGMSMVLWSTDTKDWQQPPYLSTSFERRIIARAEAGGAMPHPIVLMHADKASHEPDCDRSGCRPGQVSAFRGNTLAALPTVIRFYLSHGYHFVVL